MLIRRGAHRCQQVFLAQKIAAVGNMGRASGRREGCLHIDAFYCFWIFSTVPSATGLIRIQEAIFVLHPLSFSSSLLMR